MSEEIRRLKRRKTDQLISVVDTMTQKPMGLVADLSESGMMLISNSPITQDALYQCELIFPRHLGIQAPIKAGIQELWSDSENHQGQNVVGFRFVDINNEDRMQIREWVNEPGSIYT